MLGNKCFVYNSRRQARIRFNWLKSSSNRRSVYAGAHTLCETQVNQNRASTMTPRCGMLRCRIRRRRPPAAFILRSHPQSRCTSRSWLQSDFEINYYCNFACRRVPRTVLWSAREKRQAPRFKATDSLADERRSLHVLCHLKISDVPPYVTMIKYQSRSALLKITTSHSLFRLVSSLCIDMKIWKII